MKKIKYFLIIGIAFPFIFLIFLMFMTGGISSEAVPLDPPATEEQAYHYKYVGSELGIPWDIILLTDAIQADQQGKDGIEDYNAILTSLQFCIIEEKQYDWVEKEVRGKKSVKDGTGKKNGGKKSSAEEDEDEVTVTGEWVYISTRYYKAKDSILLYLGYQEKDLSYEKAATISADVNAVAAAKSNSSRKYEAIITVNSNYEAVLRDYIKLDEENIKNVMELYNSSYLVYLYGYDVGLRDINIQLPKVTVGNVTRSDLASVAASLINFPYLFGGKSPAAGVPTSALDCSGFVDWVYIQCFGKGVSGSLGGTEIQFYSCSEISEADLKIGDLGFYYNPADMSGGQINHVGIYIGKINGQDAFIHCGGKSFGYEERPNGRVGISINVRGITNSYDCINGKTFSPAIPGTNFRYFRRPQFQFMNN